MNGTRIGNGHGRGAAIVLAAAAAIT